MEFYEFNNFEYYALILAKDEKNALIGYEEQIADLDEEEKDLAPDVITEKEALKRYKKSQIESCETEVEKEKDFYKAINLKKFAEEATEKYLILLVDGASI